MLTIYYQNCIGPVHFNIDSFDSKSLHDESFGESSIADEADDHRNCLLSTKFGKL